MLTLNEACIIAKNIFKEECNREDISQILECDNCWIISCGDPDEQAEIDPFGIVIEKNTGNVSDFILPSPEGFGLLKKAKEIKIPKF